MELTCDICDANLDSQGAFKVHIEDVHGLKVRHNGQNRKKSGYCVYWNRGHCKYSDDKCFYEHKKIPTCRYQERCNRDDCKFFHEARLRKFPFLASRPFQGFRLQQMNQDMMPERRQHRLTGRYQRTWTN